MLYAPCGKVTKKYWSATFMLIIKFKLYVYSVQCTKSLYAPSGVMFLMKPWNATCFQKLNACLQSSVCYIVLRALVCYSLYKVSIEYFFQPYKEHWMHLRQVECSKCTVETFWKKMGKSWDKKENLNRFLNFDTNSKLIDTVEHCMGWLQRYGRHQCLCVRNTTTLNELSKWNSVWFFFLYYPNVVRFTVICTRALYWRNTTYITI